MRMLSSILALFFLLWAGLAAATTIRRAGMAEILERSKLVFEGSVIGRRVTMDLWGRPVTEVRFQILDLIKGNYPGDVITLRFLGGELGDRHLEVQAMDYPQDGERGVYFVESPGHPQVHPLYGWSQGRFRIQRDEEGILRIHDAGGRPVTEVEFVRGDGARTSRGTATGVTTSRRAASRAILSLEEFKARLRRHLRESEP